MEKRAFGRVFLLVDYDWVFKSENMFMESVLCPGV